MKATIVPAVMGLLALSGCGQKGPLYLPDRGGTIVTRPANPSSEATPPKAPSSQAPTPTNPASQQTPTSTAPSPRDKDANTAETPH
jgi:predicted small lipoprotein YifL